MSATVFRAMVPADDSFATTSVNAEFSGPNHRSYLRQLTACRRVAVTPQYSHNKGLTPASTLTVSCSGTGTGRADTGSSGGPCGSRGPSSSGPLTAPSRTVLDSMPPNSVNAARVAALSQPWVAPRSAIATAACRGCVASNMRRLLGGAPLPQIYIGKYHMFFGPPDSRP